MKKSAQSSAALEDIIQHAIEEYLSVQGFDATLKQFTAERKKKQYQNTKTREIRWGQTKEEVQMSMLDAFDRGNYQMFFMLWNSHLPEELLRPPLPAVVDNEGSGGAGREPQRERRARLRAEQAEALEFYAHLHFAVRPFTDDMLAVSPSKQVAAERCAKAMAYLHTYLDTKGPFLSRKEEFLPYFSLPSVPNPMTHPAFRDLFDENWSAALRAEIEGFLNENPLKPRKLAIFTAFEHKVSGLSGSHRRKSHRKSTASSMPALNHVDEDSSLSESSHQSYPAPRAGAESLQHQQTGGASPSPRVVRTRYRSSISIAENPEEALRKVYKNREEKLLNFSKTIFSVCLEVLQVKP
mmetsp:Transcript_14598/g.23043  ORF Transcript_14598/g.23043 Transcript_14598/m.23043 type:complete len:353 (-) Transcript_14598:187-1245(-)